MNEKGILTQVYVNPDQIQITDTQLRDSTSSFQHSQSEARSRSPLTDPLNIEIKNAGTYDHLAVQGHNSSIRRSNISSEAIYMQENHSVQA